MFFEVGSVFYNAMLPELAPRHRLGRLSMLGWGAGYAGGIMSAGVDGIEVAEALGAELLGVAR